MDTKIQSYFTRYPQSDKVFENGGILFHTQGAADSYGKGDTTKYTRAQVVAAETEAADLDAKVAAAVKAEADAKAAEEAADAAKVAAETEAAAAKNTTDKNSSK
jgi:hypothetical protein